MSSNQSQSSACSERAFNELHEQHARPLRNFLFYKFGNLEKAKDCAQEAFVRLWKNCEKVIFDKAKSYLFTVANRLFLDDVAHQKVVLKFQKRSNFSGITHEKNPEYLYRHDEFKELLESAISNLPDKQRVVFLLSRIDKMPNKEIANALDISVKTVEKHIASALRKLKLELDELKQIKI